jgi:Uma2 family endonuclease
MTTLASSVPLPSHAPSPPATEASGQPRQHFTFENASWEFYEETIGVLTGSRARVIYDRGRMELVSPSNWHEVGGGVVGRMLELYAVEMDLPLAVAGSTTLQRKDLRQGVEPDRSYYVSTPAPPTSDKAFDLSKVPPPDLVLEVDVTSSSLPREPIYAAMGVPEVWRLKGTEVTVLLRNAEGKYVPSVLSLAFPNLDMPTFNNFLWMAITQDQVAAIRAFRDWIRTSKNS